MWLLDSLKLYESPKLYSGHLTPSRPGTTWFSATTLHFKILLGIAVSVLLPIQARAQSEEAFLPTWKLLSGAEKQHFIAGYLQGWNDAQKVTEVAIGYLRENPDRGVESLQSIRRLYDVSSLRAPALVREIDDFYSDPDNQSASLSKAVTAARAAIGLPSSPAGAEE